MGLYHASCVRFENKGVLIMGDSGSGKSDLALRLIDHGAVLVADDYVDIWAEGETIRAKTPPNIEGLIEVRGVGLKKCDYEKQTELHLVLELCDRGQIDRLPEVAYFNLDGAKIPQYKFDAFAVSAIAKIKMLLKDD